MAPQAEHPLEEVKLAQSGYEAHDSIIISSDVDFEFQGFHGEGSQSDPFVIGGLIIESPSTCIQISHTSVYFVIENCYLSTTSLLTDTGVYLSDVTNGIVRNNSLFGCGIQIIEADETEVSNNQIKTPTHYGISVEQCTNIQILCNFIAYPNSDGIKAEDSINCVFSQNMIKGSVDGISIFNVQASEFTFNYIRDAQSYGIRIASGISNVLYANLLDSQNQSIDNGQSNRWDDNQSIGNYWRTQWDLNQITVEGTAGSKDRYPLQVDWSYWGWGHSLPAVYQIPLPYGTTAVQNKVGWIVWNYPGPITIYRDDTLIVDSTHRQSGFLYLDAAFLSNGLHDYVLSLYDSNEKMMWDFSRSLNVIDGLFVTYPDSPDNLTLSLAGSQVNLTWSSPSNDGGNPVIEYVVYRGIKPEEMAPIATVDTTESYQDNITNLGSFVFYAVSAVNGLGEGEISDYVCNLDSHDKIVIKGNSDFSDEGWSGDGTVSNPYSLSDFLIKTNTTAINITNVDAFFVIDNCWITYDGDGRGDNSGIEMVNISNGIIRSSVFANMERGVRISKSLNCVISNCTLNSNEYGILISRSENCTVINSLFRIGGSYGVYINESKFIDVVNSQFTAYSSGINAYSSQMCSINGCFLQGMSYGVRLSTCHDFSFLNCSFVELYRGVQIYTCKNLTLNQNLFNQTTYSLESYQSYGVSLTDSEISHSNQYRRGIYLEESTFSVFHNLSLRNSGISINGYNKTHWNHIFNNVSINGEPVGYFFGVEGVSINCSLYSECLISYCTDLNLTGEVPESMEYGCHIMNSSSIRIFNMLMVELEIRNSSTIVVQNVVNSSMNIVYSYAIQISNVILDNLYITDSTNCVVSNIELPGPGSLLTITSCSNLIIDLFEMHLMTWRWLGGYRDFLVGCDNVTFQDGTIDTEYGDLRVYGSIYTRFVNVNIGSLLRISQSNSSEISNCILSCHGTNILLYHSLNATISDCEMTGGGLEISGVEMYHWYHRIEDSTLNNQPILYFSNRSDLTFDEQQFGQAIFVGCSQIAIRHETFWYTSYPIQMAFCQQVDISNVEIYNDQGATYNSPQIYECSNIRVSEIDYYNHSARFLLRSSTDILVENCSFFYNSGLGVDGDSSTCTIRNCHFQDSDGISISRVFQCKITGNTLWYGFYGISIEWGNAIQIINNALEGDYGIYLHQSQNSVISYNSIISSKGQGVYLDHGGYNLYHRNRIIRSSYVGIRIWGEQNSTFVYNEIKENRQQGIFCDYGSFNRFYGNLLARNTEEDAVDNGVDNEWDDGEKLGNCWGFSESLYPSTIPGSAQSIDHYPLLSHDRELVSPVIAHRFNVSSRVSLEDIDTDILWCYWGTPGRIEVFVDGVAVKDEQCQGCGFQIISVKEYGLANYTLQITDSDGNVEISTIDLGAEIRLTQSILAGTLSVIGAGSLLALTILFDLKRRRKKFTKQKRKVENEKEELLEALEDLKATSHDD
ncbi:MAG: NosD domain-containing protein [Candidatus Thorarchaeota archaeon]